MCFQICKKHPGFLRVHIADPAPDRKFYRRGWVTFEKLGNIREICLEMLSIKVSMQFYELRSIH